MRTLQLGDFHFDPATGELTRDGTTVRLEPQPAVILTHLASRPGVLVSRDELARLLWTSDTHVNFDEGVNYAIRRIRLALGDDARSPRFIETMPKRGYRLLTVGPGIAIERAESGACSSPAADRAPTITVESLGADTRGATLPLQRTPAKAIAAALAVAIIVFGVVLVEQRPNRHHDLTVATVRALHDALFGPSPASSDNPH